MRRLIFIFLMTVIAVSCGDDYKSSIPDVRFDFSCSLVQAEYSKLTTPGQFIKKTKNVHGIPVGYAGIIIGQSVYSDGYTDLAFEAACPVEASRTVSINVQNDGLGKAICPSCGTTYDLNNGGAPTGAGKEYLKRYTAVVSGTTLQVRN